MLIKTKIKLGLIGDKLPNLSYTTLAWIVCVGGWVGLGLIIMSNLNRVRLSCCWVGVGLGCDNYSMGTEVKPVWSGT